MYPATPLTIDPKLLRPGYNVHTRRGHSNLGRRKTDSLDSISDSKTLTPYPNSIFPLAPTRFDLIPCSPYHPLATNMDTQSSRVWMTSDWSLLPLYPADESNGNSLSEISMGHPNVLSHPESIPPNGDIQNSTSPDLPVNRSDRSSHFPFPRFEEYHPSFLPRQLTYQQPQQSASSSTTIEIQSSGDENRTVIWGTLASPIQLASQPDIGRQEFTLIALDEKKGQEEEDDYSDTDSGTIDIDLSPSTFRPKTQNAPSTVTLKGRAKVGTSMGYSAPLDVDTGNLIHFHRSSASANEDADMSDGEVAVAIPASHPLRRLPSALSSSTSGDFPLGLLDSEPISMNGRYPSRLSQLRSTWTSTPSSDSASDSSGSRSQSASQVNTKVDEDGGPVPQKESKAKGKSKGKATVKGRGGSMMLKKSKHRRTEKVEFRSKTVTGNSRLRSHRNTRSSTSISSRRNGSSSSVPSTNRLKQLPTGSFLWSAMHMLTLPKHCEYVQWDEAARQAFIPDVSAFAANVYNQYCTSNMWTSFQRNMTNYQGWGYRRLAVEGSNLKQQTITVPTFNTIDQKWKARGLPLAVLEDARDKYLAATAATSQSIELQHVRRRSANMPKIALKAQQSNALKGLEEKAETIGQDDHDEMTAKAEEQEEERELYSEEEMGGPTTTNNKAFASHFDGDVDEEEEETPLAKERAKRLQDREEAETAHLTLSLGGRQLTPPLTPVTDPHERSEELQCRTRNHSLLSLGADEDIDRIRCSPNLFSPASHVFSLPSRLPSPSPSLPETPLYTPCNPSFASQMSAPSSSHHTHPLAYNGGSDGRSQQPFCSQTPSGFNTFYRTPCSIARHELSVEVEEDEESGFSQATEKDD